MVKDCEDTGFKASMITFLVWSRLGKKLHVLQSGSCSTPSNFSRADFNNKKVYPKMSQKTSQIE